MNVKIERWGNGVYDIETADIDLILSYQKRAILKGHYTTLLRLNSGNYLLEVMIEKD